MSLKNLMLDHVARNLSRSRVTGDGHAAKMASWAAEQEKARPEALEKINAMSNADLIDTLEEALIARGVL